MLVFALQWLSLHWEILIMLLSQFPLTLFVFFLKLGFTPCNAKQPLQGMELQEKEPQKDYRIQEISLEWTYSQ